MSITRVTQMCQSLFCSVPSGKHGSLYHCCTETALQMYETFGAAYPLESVYAIIKMSHSLGVNSAQEASSSL